MVTLGIGKLLVLPLYTKGNLHMVWGEGPKSLLSHCELSAPHPATYACKRGFWWNKNVWARL